MSNDKKVVASRPTKGKRYGAEERKTHASQIVNCVKTDVSNEQNIAKAVEGMHVLSLIGPDEKNPKKLFGYKPSQIRHSVDTYRGTRCAVMLAILDSSSKYPRTQDLLVEVVKYFSESGKKAPCRQMLVEKTEGNNVTQELHDNVTEGFSEVWNRSSNLQITLPELQADFESVLKHADTTITRWAERVAKRTVVLEDQDVQTTFKGQPVTLTGQSVETYADPVCRAYFESKEAEQRKEAERKRKLTDKQKGIEHIDTQIQKVKDTIDRLDIGKPAVGKWTDDSSIALDEAWNNVLAALKDVKVTMSEGKTVTAAQMKKAKKSK